MDKITARVALGILRVLKAREIEYREDVDAWYRSGDGRSPKWRRDPETGRSYNYGGKGYAYPYCEHGTSNWTDYDNICGGCEGDNGTLYERALWEAQEKVAEYNRRADWVLSAPDSFPWEKKRELIEWVSEPIR